MDDTIRYGLEFNPFLKNSKEIFVSTDESKEVLFRLNCLAKTKDFGLLTGSPCRGKTTAIRNWVQIPNNPLFNFKMDFRNRAVVLLSGLPSLNATLRPSVHEPFWPKGNRHTPVFLQILHACIRLTVKLIIY